MVAHANRDQAGDALVKERVGMSRAPVVARVDALHVQEYVPSFGHQSLFQQGREAIAMLPCVRLSVAKEQLAALASFIGAGYRLQGEG